MASLGGKGALAFTQGIKSGFELVDKGLDSSQRRQNVAQEMQERAELRKAQLKTQATQVTGMEIKQELDQVKLDAVAAVRKDNAAKQVPSILNGWINGEATAKDTRQFLTNNPEMQQALGVKNVATVGDITPQNATDRDGKLYEYLTTHYGNEGQQLDQSQFMIPDADGTGLVLDKEAYDEALISTAGGLSPILKTADGVILDIFKLGTMTGASKHLLTAQQRKTEETLAGIYKQVDTVKPSTNQELMAFAKNEIKEADYPTDKEYQKAVNAKFLELKRASGKGSMTPADIRKMEHLQGIVNDPKSSKEAVTQAKGMLEKMRTTGTQININSAVDRNSDLVDPIKDTQDPFSMTNLGGDITEDQANKEATFEQSPKYNAKFQAREDDFIGTASIVNDTQELTKDLESAIEDGNFKSGWFDSKLEWLAQRDPTGLIKSSAEQLRAGADLDTVGADVLKAYSGASATELEYIRTMARIFGDPNMQEEDRLTLFRNFMGKTEDKYNRDAQYMLRNHRYSTVKNASEASGLTTKEETADVEEVATTNDATIEGFDYE